MLWNGKTRASSSFGWVVSIDLIFLNGTTSKMRVCGVYHLELKGEAELGKDEQKQLSWSFAESFMEHTVNTRRCFWSLHLLDLK